MGMDIRENNTSLRQHLQETPQNGLKEDESRQGVQRWEAKP